MPHPDHAPALPHPPALHRGIGERFVRWLSMRLPDDPVDRRLQSTFAALTVVGAAFAWLQAAAVVLVHDASAASTIERSLANVFLAASLTVSVLGPLRRARLRDAARLAMAAMLVYTAFFAWRFGLRPFTTILVAIGPILAALVVVERRALTPLWFLATIGIVVPGLLREPSIGGSQLASAVAVSATLAMLVLVLYVHEFRVSLGDAVDEARAQACALAAANDELRRAGSEHERLSQELRAAQRLEAMGRLAGNVAHDFNNLLTAMRAYVDLVAADPAAPTAQDDLRELARTIDRAGGLTGQLLAFARRRPVARAPLDLALLVEENARILEQLAGTRIHVRRSLPREPAVVLGDRTQLEQVLVNLVVNARDAMPDGGTLDITVGSGGTADTVRLSVRDEGVGIPAEIRDRIFEPFFSTKGGGGTGLGLATCYGIVQQHAGSLSVTSTPGEGSTFHVDLPRIAAVPRRPTPLSVAAHVEDRPLAGRSVVVVEDDPGVRRAVVRLLERMGAEVDAAADGADGIEAIGRLAMTDRRPALVLSDVVMPRAGGAAVMDAARARFPGVPRLLMSGHHDDPAVTRLIEDEGVAFLPKPFTEAALRDQVVGLLSGRADAA
jgi:signal transduction histidine kinase/ActR/RegA family two-component response regulator